MQRQGTAGTLPELIVLFCVLFVCKCVHYYCRWVSTQLHITNIYIYTHQPHKTKYKRLRQSADYSLLRLTLCQHVRSYQHFEAYGGGTKILQNISHHLLSNIL
jgi:hypothetical protein